MGADARLTELGLKLPPAPKPAGVYKPLLIVGKKTAIHNEYFPTFAEFQAAVEGFFARLDDYRDEIAGLITDRFHFIGKFNPQAPQVAG